MVTDPMRPEFLSTTRTRSEAVAGFIWTKRSKGRPLESRFWLDGQLAGIAGVWWVDCRAADADVGEAVVEHLLRLV